ncbi:hypothetical protein ACQP2F_01225 [Actinoplanes sp. CA-030573]|uniref:hypothetical protein n=1 Tax=Actinoplanes sp. CA-030573 TaxID=3239898 RepID=UPI003D91829E
MRWCGLAAGTALLAAGVSAPQGMAATTRQLPACPAGKASTRPPTTPAGPAAPGACRAAGRVLESAVQLTQPGQTGFTPSGYHHLGANSAGEWSGVSGRISVVDGSIRPGSYDFVAGRFMVKRNMGGGRINWLEAGWAQTGWAGPLRQHIYTFNTNTRTWQFYDQYALRPGDRVWIDLHSDPSGVWGAWLWWNNRWNLLTAQRLPIGQSAYVEQYVEVHVDSGRPARIDVPEVTVDNVQLRPPDGGAARYWRDDVPTLTGYDAGQRQMTGGFCLNWVNRYDTWTAGDCGDAIDQPPAALPPSADRPTNAINPARGGATTGTSGDAGAGPGTSGNAGAGTSGEAGAGAGTSASGEAGAGAGTSGNAGARAGTSAGTGTSGDAGAGTSGNAGAGVGTSASGRGGAEPSVQPAQSAAPAATGSPRSPSLLGGLLRGQ